jgi:hypothetical protein
MANPTLLQVIQTRFNIKVDRDSDGGQILDHLTPDHPLGTQFTGRARAAALGIVPTTHGLSMRAAAAKDAFVINIPNGPFEFTILEPDATHRHPRVALKLTSIEIPLPFIHAAQLNSQGMLSPASGTVKITLPPLVLMITASDTTPASAALEPGQTPTTPAGIKLTMTPSFASFDADHVLGFGFKDVFLVTTGEPRISFPKLDVFIAPPAMPALAMKGSAEKLNIPLGANTGVSGHLIVPLPSGAAPARPRFLREMKAEVILNRGSLILLKLDGLIAVGEEARLRLPALTDQTSIRYTVAITRDNGWQTALALGRGEEILWQIRRQNAAQQLALNTLGAYVVFAPLFPNNAASVVSSIVQSLAFSTESIKLLGCELRVESTPAGERTVLYFDVETEIQLDFKIKGMQLKSSRPFRVRNKALGVDLNFGSNGSLPVLTPRVDHLQGFQLDLSDPGMLQIVGNALGDLFKPEGARISQDIMPGLPQPQLNLEMDLITKANLGVVTIDRAGVRVPLDVNHAPTLTALGAHLNAGLIAGGGYLRILDGGVAGSLDIALGMLGVRGSARLRLENKTEEGDSFTALQAALALEWPVPIPLASSGAGLFGLNGLFAMHMERKAPPDVPVLKWFQTIPGGDVSNPDVWSGQRDQWAFGAGAVLGTLEGGFLIHAKGMILLELPGPRILLFMKADILKARPPVKGNQNTGTFHALMEISEDSLTIGIIFDYTALKPLVEVHIPVEAFFNFHLAKDWHLTVGGIPIEKRALVTFLDSFTAEGYFLIRGNGIPDFPPGPLDGFSVAVGIRAAFIWGPKSIGLYLQITLQADIGIGFDPFYLAGRAGISGELHLFIVSIGVSAFAEIFLADKAQIRARVCGKVEFIFFDVEGCVTLELGERPSRPPAPKLVRELSLHSRMPALLLGTATDDGVDASLGKALHREKEGAPWLGDLLPEVPIDTIPVLQLEMRPGVVANTMFFNSPIPSLIATDSEPVLQKEKIPEIGWLKRGESFYHYRIKAIELQRVTGNDAPLGDPLMFPAGPPPSSNIPATWWDRRGSPSRGYDNDVQLALLTWQVDPTPSAAERSQSREETITHRWGSVCDDVAPLAKNLWTFENVMLGPSRTGWTLTGTRCRKTADSAPSARMNLTLRVTELWRTGDLLQDAGAFVTPAWIFGSTRNDGRALIAAHRRFEQFAPPGLGSIAALISPANFLRFDGGGLVRVGGLVFAERGQWTASCLVVRSVDIQGRILQTEPIHPGNSRLIDTRAKLAALYAGTVCAAAIESLQAAWFENSVPGLHQPVLVHFERTLAPGTYQADLGLDCEEADRWGLLSFEAITRGEQQRFDFDKTNRESQISAVDGALHSDESLRALLRPDSFYITTIRYDAADAEANSEGQPDTRNARIESRIQQFRFKTKATVPARLDPWILTTDPAPGQNFFFFRDPLHITFATNATRQLFAAYNQQLFAVARPAKGNSPPPEKLPSLGSVSDGPVKVQPLVGALFSAFDSAVKVSLEGKICREFQRESIKHERITLQLPLEPLTDYVLDMEPHDVGTGVPVPLENPNFPLYRIHFSTSRYGTFNEFARKVKESRIVHRWLEKPGPLENLKQLSATGKQLELNERQLEQAFMDAEWGDLGRASEPRVTIIWVGALEATPQPFAVLLETPEPHWRVRSVPQGAKGNDAAPIKRNRLVPARWLEIAEPGPLVTRLIFSTAKDRTLIFLASNARGATLNLSLHRTFHPLIEAQPSPPDADLLSVELKSAPWEEAA